MENNSNKKRDYGIPVLTWLAPEYPEVHRGPLWVSTAAASALLMIFWAIWQDTWTFAIVVILLAGIYFLTHGHKPKTIEISLTTRGIHAGKQFFSYSDIQAFWMYYKPEQDLKVLNIVLKSGFVREFSYQLNNQDPAEVQSFLASHIFEFEGREESTVEKLIRVLKL